MYVPSYQMHKVLALYAKRLERSAEISRESTAGRLQPSEDIMLAAEGKRRTVIDRVAATIVERIIAGGLPNRDDNRIVGACSADMAEASPERSVWTSEFCFNRIDAGDQKRTERMTVGDGGFVLRRLEQMTGETQDRQSTPGEIEDGRRK
jgi:hypothetical protein